MGEYSGQLHERGPDVVGYVQNRRDEIATERDPTPFALEPNLDLQAVLGHSSVARATPIDNRAPHPNSVTLAIVGTDAGAFAIDGPTSFNIGGTAEGAAHAIMSVRFVPLKVGPAEAVLLVNHRYGQQFIALRGNAMQGDGAVTPRAPGALPAVSPLEAATPSTDAGGAADRVRVAARHLAEAGERYNALAPAGRAAAAQLKQTGIDSGQHVNSRITTWLRDEGIDDIQKLASASSAVVPKLVKGAIAKVLDKSIEAAELEGTWYMKVAKLVVDKALEHVEKSTEKHEHKDEGAKASEHFDGVAAAAGKTGDELTVYLLARLDSVASGFADANATLRDTAIVGVPSLLKRLSADLPDIAGGNAGLGARDYEEAIDKLTAFANAESSFHVAVSQVAQFGTSVPANLDAAFGNMLDRYIVARHEQVKDDASQEAGEASEHMPFDVKVPPKEQSLEVQVSGNLDLEAKRPVQLDRLKIEGIGHVGTTVQSHVAHKQLAQLGAYDVTISLLHARFGKAVLKQRDQVRSVEMGDELGAEVSRTGGIERIWAILDEMEIGDRGGKL